MRLNKVEHELIKYYNWTIEDIKNQRKINQDNRDQVGLIVSIGGR
jgi:hypothetical protein